MSLYREARTGRRRLWLAAGAVLAAVVIVVVVLVAQGSEPSAAESLASLQDDVQPALAALELVPIHYESTNATTHAAAADQLEVARETVEANRTSFAPSTGPERTGSRRSSRSSTHSSARPGGTRRSSGRRPRQPPSCANSSG